MNIAAYIQKEIDKGFYQTSLAKRLGVHPSMITKYKLGYSVPGIKVASIIYTYDKTIIEPYSEVAINRYLKG